jgi:hypothetical protein
MSYWQIELDPVLWAEQLAGEVNERFAGLLSELCFEDCTSLSLRRTAARCSPGAQPIVEVWVEVANH